MKILLVEPDRVIADAAEGVLLANGHQVMRAQSAQAAIAAADSNKPDVVVLELALPFHNGIEFLHEFRSYADWSHVPAVLFTTIKLLEPELFTVFGVQQYLYKPDTSLQQLHTTLQRLQVAA